ncbi:MAG TPA: hypothetical protein GXX72_07280 [Clostridiaceae bacterium]|nr:hypothetical protein [Clostridiaceae bacterium]
MKDFRFLALALTLLVVITIWIVQTPFAPYTLNSEQMADFAIGWTSAYKAIVKTKTIQSIILMVFGAGFLWLANIKSKPPRL